jgi:hypothetical protein
VKEETDALENNGKTLIRNWDKKKTNYTNDKNSKGFNSTVYYNPKSNHDDRGNKRPAFIGLAHELHHAFTFLTGTNKGGSTVPNSNISIEELTAIFFENKVRRQYDIPLRSKYNGKTIPYMPIIPDDGGPSPKNNPNER